MLVYKYYVHRHWTEKLLTDVAAKDRTLSDLTTAREADAQRKVEKLKRLEESDEFVKRYIRTYIWGLRELTKLKVDCCFYHVSSERWLSANAKGSSGSASISRSAPPSGSSPGGG